MDTLLSFREFDAKIAMMEGREVETLDDETENSATESLQQLNKMLKCSGYQVALSIKQCETLHKKLQVIDLAELGTTSEEIQEKFPTEKSCIVIGNLEKTMPLGGLIKSQIPASEEACLTSFKVPEIDKFIRSLQTCMWEMTSYIDQVKTNFEVPKKMVAETIHQLTEIKTDFSAVRL